MTSVARNLSRAEMNRKLRDRKRELRTAEDRVPDEPQERLAQAGEIIRRPRSR